MTSELLRLPRPSMGEFPWTKSCKPAIGNQHFHQILPQRSCRTRQSEGSFHLGAFIAAQQVMPPSDHFPGKKTGGGGGGGHDAGNHLDGECQNPLTP